MQPFSACKQPIPNGLNAPLPRWWRSKFAYLIDRHGESGTVRILHAMARAWERQTGNMGTSYWR